MRGRIGRGRAGRRDRAVRGRGEAGGVMLTETVRSPKRGSNNVVEIHRRQRPADGSAFTVDEEFSRLIPPLTPDEHRLLEEQILADGCREPLVIWKEEMVLLDGHHRHRICTKHGLPFATEMKSAKSRFEARAFVRGAALGRRNVNDEMRRYLWGSQYEDEKREYGGIRRGSGSSPQSGDLKPGKTADRLAAELKTSKNTIERAGRYARALDAIAESHPDLKDAILSRSTRLTSTQVGEVAAAPAEERLELVRKLTEKKDPDDAGSGGTSPGASETTDDTGDEKTKRVGNYRTRTPEALAKDKEIGGHLADGKSTAEAAKAADVPVWRVNKAKQELGLCRSNTLLDRLIFQARTNSDSLGLVLEALEKNHIDGNAEQWGQLAEALKNARVSADKASKLAIGRKQ